jgi:mannose-6-phosphate isomerase-like protein (cupin superfamily)
LGDGARRRFKKIRPTGKKPAAKGGLKMTTGQNYLLAQLDEIAAQPCPCGQTRRAFVARDNPVATLHMVDIEEDARTHYHKKLTEIYLVLEGEGWMELDGERVAVKPMAAIFIKPGCRHRAVGKLRIVNIPIPAFDADDEWFD